MYGCQKCQTYWKNQSQTIYAAVDIFDIFNTYFMRMSVLNSTKQL